MTIYHCIYNNRFVIQNFKTVIMMKEKIFENVNLSSNM